MLIFTLNKIITHTMGIDTPLGTKIQDSDIYGGVISDEHFLATYLMVERRKDPS